MTARMALRSGSCSGACVSGSRRKRVCRVVVVGADMLKTQRLMRA